MSQEPDNNDSTTNKREQRAMWIFSALVVVLLLGAMGANVLFHHETPTTTDVSAQTRKAPAK